MNLYFPGFQRKFFAIFVETFPIKNEIMPSVSEGKQLLTQPGQRPGRFSRKEGHMNKNNQFLTFSQGSSQYRFLPTGDVFTFTNGPFLANQFRGNIKDGSVNNIYLRIHEQSSITAYPLLGVKSPSKISCSAQALCQSGQIGGISYEILFRPSGPMWFWDVSLSGTGQTVDLLYGQDLGAAPEGNVYTNELYTSQYLGHSIFEGENGYVICSRQNLPSDSCNPYLQQGVLGAKAIHYATDGLQFFGLSCKDTETPACLFSDLPDQNLQYEFAYAALQTEKIFLNGTTALSFYGLFLPHHPAAISLPEYRDEIRAAWEKGKGSCRDGLRPVPSFTLKKDFHTPYSSPAFNEEEIHALFPNRHLEERCSGTLFSFFTPDHAHVVTKAKELRCERPHGTIIITPPDEAKVNSALISSTQYMYGVFNSHVVTGNTDLHKFLSTPRGFLNLLKNSGQRLYVRCGQAYRLLTLPGLFEMGMNYSRWFYKLDDDILTVTAYTAADAPDLALEVSSQNGLSYDFILTNQLTMGPNEYEKEIICQRLPRGLRYVLDNAVYPGLHYDLILSESDYCISDDRIFFEEGRGFDSSFLTLTLKQKTGFRAAICGCLFSREPEENPFRNFSVEKKRALSYYENMIRHFSLQHPSGSRQLSILNETVWWYTHNALIHFSMPHGLEQPGGAAWGTRDICQGPFEFFLATQHYDLARDILLHIFSRQSSRTKEWPQWFMFDRYAINAGECHGDVVFWPLKCAADYLEATGDTGILSEQLPYDEAESRKDTLLAHIRLAFSNIRETRMIEDTGLITYAGGDWDDTLQPANEAQKKHLVSSWTVALAYQTFSGLAHALRSVDAVLADEFSSFAGLTKSAFENILIKDGVVAGFLDCREGRRYMLHPDDLITGIHCRLLPMTRSIIAELVSSVQAQKNKTIIQENLKCPDGVRLMDHPAGYDGGVSHLFKRAEQAANVGREISLQYTHAHIRYVEAMAKLGEAKEAWDCMFTVNPILIQDSVPNAAIRQSNLYFSSSDGAFADRYDYARGFRLLKTGSIPVKGGWRLYSSGPGIYLRQLIGSLFGIRFCSGGLILDPVLPEALDNTALCYDCFGISYRFRYHIAPGQRLCARAKGRAIAARAIPNPYRRSALLISREELERCGRVIDVYLE